MIYEYKCEKCGAMHELQVSLDKHVRRVRCGCGGDCYQHFSKTPVFRFAGVPTKGGGPDKFTADMLGIPLKELPDGLRTTSAKLGEG